MSELRQDPVSGDWIIVVPERARRPQDFFAKKEQRKPSPKKTCPFEDAKLRKSTHWPPILSSPSENAWKVVVVPNKYPALTHFTGCSTITSKGPHRSRTGAGEHDLVITRDHRKNFADLSPDAALQVFKIMQRRYRMLAKDACNVYSSAFFNWGASAGASIYHPHYQILTLPIIPPDVAHSLNGSRRYFEENKTCVHCAMLRFDFGEKERVIDKNERAVSIAPYISRVPFEVRVFPRRHLPHFQATPDRDLRDVVLVLQRAMKRIKKYLKDPDLNFFIHTAPLKDHHYSYYHWHIEITPKVTVWGGFELGTGIDINVVDPKIAAAVLKGQKMKN